MEDRNSPVVSNFSLHNVSGVWVSVLTITWCVSTAVSELTLGVDAVLTMFGVTCCCKLTLSSTDASVGVVVIVEDIAFTFLVASTYDNVLVLS